MSQFWKNKNSRIAISQMDNNYLLNAIKFCEKNNMMLNGGRNDDWAYDEGETDLIDLSETYERLKLEVRLRSIETKLGLVSDPEYKGER